MQHLQIFYACLPKQWVSTGACCTYLITHMNLTSATRNFSLLEEFVECRSNNGVDVCGQVGTNWVHAGGKSPGHL